MKCSVADCERPVIARTWCFPHYQRWRRTGDVRASEPVIPTERTATDDQTTLDCIARFQVENGYSPTYTDIAKCLGLANKSSVHWRMDRLRKAGLIETHGRSRAIVIVKGK